MFPFFCSIETLQYDNGDIKRLGRGRQLPSAFPPKVIHQNDVKLWQELKGGGGGGGWGEGSLLLMSCKAYIKGVIKQAKFVENT